MWAGGQALLPQLSFQPRQPNHGVALAETCDLNVGVGILNRVYDLECADFLSARTIIATRTRDAAASSLETRRCVCELCTSVSRVKKVSASGEAITCVGVSQFKLL